MRTSGGALFVVMLALAAGCRRAPAESDEPAAGPKRVRCAPAESRDLQDLSLIHI